MLLLLSSLASALEKSEESTGGLRVQQRYAFVVSELSHRPTVGALPMRHLRPFLDTRPGGGHPTFAVG